jgi:hypothetical protein
MKQFKLLILLLVIGFVADAQINYLPMKSRYTWIAGKFDSTLHIPSGTTTSLRTGGYDYRGAVFYRTSDSTVYVYTGTQWISVKGAGGSSDSTIFATLYRVDTAKTNIRTTLDTKIDSMRRVGLNVQAYKNGTWITQFTDSVGTSGGVSDTSVFIVDTLYNRIATTINADSLRLKSLRIRNGTTTITPTVTDSTLSFDVTGTTYKIGTYNSQTINGDGASIVADSIYMQEFSAESPGLVPPGGSGSTYLRGDGTWQTVSGGSTTGVKSIAIVGDSAYLVNDSNTLTGTKVYGYYNGTKGWKESKKMTFVIPYDGEVVMISGDSLTNGRKVDSIYRTVGKDSIIFNIAGVRYAIKDSTGAGGGTPGGSTTQVQYNDAGAFAGSANMTFDGTRLTLPGSSTNSAIKAGTIELQSLAVNNAWFGENVYYSGGWKTRATGYAPMFYFPTGSIQMQTISSSVAAGGAITPLTRIKIQTDGRVAVGPNVGSLTATAHLHLANGGSTASSAPLKFYLTGATVLTTPEAGAVEAVVDTLYYTGNDATRKKVGLVTAGSPFLASGTHTPTATNGTNVTASTPGQTQYMRVGNTVTVSGYIEITCTTLGITSQIDLTIPVASAFTNTTQLSGTMLEAVVGVASPGHGTVISQATNDRLSIDFTPRATGSLSYRFTYTYQVL